MGTQKEGPMKTTTTQDQKVGAAQEAVEAYDELRGRQREVKKMQSWLGLHESLAAAQRANLDKQMTEQRTRAATGATEEELSAGRDVVREAAQDLLEGHDFLMLAIVRHNESRFGHREAEIRYELALRRLRDLGMIGEGEEAMLREGYSPPPTAIRQLADS